MAEGLDATLGVPVGIVPLAKINSERDNPVIRSNLATVLLDLGDLEGAKQQAELALEICAGLPDGGQVRVDVMEAVQSVLNRLE